MFLKIFTITPINYIIFVLFLSKYEFLKNVQILLDSTFCFEKWL